MNQIHDTYIHFSEERALITMVTFIKTHFLWDQYPDAHQANTSPFELSLRIGRAHFESNASRSLEELLVEAERLLFVKNWDKRNG
jgi:hypothetical protein